jgi:hypothetical protein
VVIEPKNNINIYPNPTNGIATMVIEDYQNIDCLMLFDIYGRLLNQVKIESSTTSIDLTRYSPGMYIVNLRKEGRTIKNLKVVKK